MSCALTVFAILPVSKPSKSSEPDMDYSTTRKEAKAKGDRHYFTGRPCLRGHVALRETKGHCVECRREDMPLEAERRKGKPKTAAAKEAGRRYYEKNRQTMLAKAKEQCPEARRAYRKAWKRRNMEYTRANAHAWKRRTREASPPWLTPTHKAEIAAIYAEARGLTKTTGDKYVVDHVVPLRHPDVCGLHVPWNLQIMSHEENCQKGNRHSWE